MYSCDKLKVTSYNWPTNTAVGPSLTQDADNIQDTFGPKILPNKGSRMDNGPFIMQDYQIKSHEGKKAFCICDITHAFTNLRTNPHTYKEACVKVEQSQA